MIVGRYLKQGTKFITKSRLAEALLKRKGIKESNITVIGVGMDAQMLTNGDCGCTEPLYLTMKQDEKVKLLYIV